LALALALVAAAGTAYAAPFTFGVDLSVLASVSQLKCMRTASPAVSHVVVRAFRSTGSVDPNAIQTLKNAQAAGFDPANVGVYIFPRPLSVGGKMQDGGAQVKATMDYLLNNGAGGLFQTLWLDFEGASLYWSKITSNNAKFVDQMLTAARTYVSKYKVGIYTSKSQWAPIVGSTYTGGKDFPLWYANYNNRKDFSDFSPFAGWTTAALHQYAGDTKVCNVGVDLNVMQAGTLVSVASAAVVNGGTPPPPPPIANSVKCANVRGACKDVSVSPCVGSVQKGLCSGSSNIVCCVGSAPVLGSSFNGAAAASLPPSTPHRVVATAVDTGKVSWYDDGARGRHAARKMKMGTLMRIKRKHRKNRKHKKRKMVPASTGEF